MTYDYSVAYFLINEKKKKKTFGVLLCQKKCDDMRETAGDK